RITVRLSKLQVAGKGPSTSPNQRSSKTPVPGTRSVFFELRAAPIPFHVREWLSFAKTRSCFCRGRIRSDFISRRRGSAVHRKDQSAWNGADNRTSGRRHQNSVSRPG